MLSQEQVNYGPGQGLKRCVTCVMFRPGLLYPGRCTLVQGDIRRLDVCDRWAGVRLP